ncbi:ornithine carbamoyltransferase [Methanosalsum natronophilum]|uniref:Ornithine carbamoyltransferase n=1 Tax=Methanosalsum natronophilum TaxID=768733 RepID=A0A3R7VX25_9EURY|nr:ornithine carbamoyltransferase [Methanosalsum natronophilum]MCS3924723.1 ornithine carbamoyltransferase [Methanosalsum natronophilum]RQD82819.1 MAG: ornithine carbamoyltransferase [Methanosalsum natronophilum]
MKHLISMADLSPENLIDILDIAETQKQMRLRGKNNDSLKNKSLAMIFEKSSTRTRVSFEVAMSDLGGHSLYLNYNDIQIGRGETIEDTSKVLSRYVHGICARVNNHNTVLELARNSNIPVINALSDIEHPCQTLADMLTIKEYKKKFCGLKLAWIGDGNNVCNSTIIGCALLGIDIHVACPKGYEPRKQIVDKARSIGGVVEITNDAYEAALNADILYTDVWVSMGEEEEKLNRLNAFSSYQINSDIVNKANNDVIVMHCLPAHRGEEITAEVIDGPHSVVFDQAENRLHAQKALLIKLMC